MKPSEICNRSRMITTIGVFSIVSPIIAAVIFYAFADPFNIPKKFDLTVIENYGCETSYNTYINYHYENGLFKATRASDLDVLQYEILPPRSFQHFFTKIQKFNLFALDSSYSCGIGGTARGTGIIRISINNSKHTTKYVTAPCKGTKLRSFHDWIYTYSSGISKEASFQSLLESKFYLNSDMSLWPVHMSIEKNSSLMRVDDFIATIDTTKNTVLKSTLIQGLKYFYDEKILDLLGPMLLDNLDYIQNADIYWWETENSKLLESIIAQNKSDKKTAYLNKFLKSKNNDLRYQSAIALALDGDSSGINQLLESINRCLSSTDHCFKWDEFSAITHLDESKILPRLVTEYNYSKATPSNYPNSKWITSGYITLLSNAINKAQILTSEEFRLASLNMRQDVESMHLDSLLRKEMTARTQMNKSLRPKNMQR